VPLIFLEVFLFMKLLNEEVELLHRGLKWQRQGREECKWCYSMRMKEKGREVLRAKNID